MEVKIFTREDDSPFGFAYVHDQHNLARLLSEHGMFFTETVQARKVIRCLKGNTLKSCVKAIRRTRNKRGGLHVHMECPFLHRIWDVEPIERHKIMFQKVSSRHSVSQPVREIYNVSQNYLEIASYEGLTVNLI